MTPQEIAEKAWMNGYNKGLITGADNFKAALKARLEEEMKNDKNSTEHKYYFALAWGLIDEVTPLK